MAVQTVKLNDIIMALPKSKIKAGDGINSGKYKFFTCSPIQSKYYDSFTYEGESLIMGTGGNANIHYCNEKFATSTDCLVFQKKGNLDINLKCVYYLLYGNIDLLQRGFKGCGLQHISKDYILNIEINLPERNVQDKIVDIFDRYNKVKQLKLDELTAYDNLVKSQFIEMFGDPECNPYKYDKHKLDYCIETLTDFSANGSYEFLDSNVVMYDEPNYAIMVRTTDLENNSFNDGIKYIDKQAYNLLSKSKLFGGELIMNKIGSAGKIYIMPCLNKPMSLGRNAFLIRVNEKAEVIFLYHLLSTRYGEKEIHSRIRGAVTKTITKDSVRSIDIILPPIALQNEFARFVEQTDKSKILCELEVAA